MNRNEAEAVLKSLMTDSSPTTWRERRDFLLESKYPAIANLYCEWLKSSLSRKDFEDKAVEHIMTANTKLYKALK